MFERYTEKARRVIFFARYEASEFGAPCIETEHILLGLLKEDDALANRFLRALQSSDSIRQSVRAVTPARARISTFVRNPMTAQASCSTYRTATENVPGPHPRSRMWRDPGFAFNTPRMACAYVANDKFIVGV